LQNYSDYFDIVRFFGHDHVDPERVRIEYAPEVFSFSDQKIRQFAAMVAGQLRKQGRLYDGPMITNVASARFDPPDGTVTIQPAHYDDHAGSCFALDEPDQLFDNLGGTLREYYKRHYPDSGLDGFPLAACLGVCAYVLIVESKKRFLLQVHRSSSLASLEGSYGPSAAGSVDFYDGDRTLADVVGRSMGQELSEELGLSGLECDIVPLAWAREKFRGEHPQIFCLVETPLTREQIRQGLDQLAPEKREFDDYRFLELEDDCCLSPDWLNRLNHEAAMNHILISEYLNQ
jgi:hypothetical protein